MMGYVKLLSKIRYADDARIISEGADDLHDGLDCLYKYCSRWSLEMNTEKTKVMVAQKGRQSDRNVSFHYNEKELETVNNFSSAI